MPSPRNAHVLSTGWTPGLRGWRARNALHVLQLAVMPFRVRLVQIQHGAQSSNRIVRTGQVGFVHDQDVRDLQDARFDGLDVVASGGISTTMVV